MRQSWLRNINDAYLYYMHMAAVNISVHVFRSAQKLE